MNEENAKILEFKRRYLEENQKRYNEIRNNLYYRRMIKYKKAWSPYALYEEALDIISLLEKNEIPDSVKEYAHTLAIVSLAAIQDEKLINDNRMILKK